MDLTSIDDANQWDVWPCSHDCTGFFKIDPAEVRAKIPAPLQLHLIDGRAHIEVGYARFRPSHGLPAFEELSWGIAVVRVEGSGFAFYSPSLTSNEQGFLDYNEKIGFKVFPKVKIVSDLERQQFAAYDQAGNEICVLRHQPRDAFTLPFFLKKVFLKPTEVWTDGTGELQSRTFDWRGTARVYQSWPVASTLNDHPFFQGVRVSRAEPVPYEMFSSTAIAKARQLFTFPRRKVVARRLNRLA
ncbi:hypothetical protein BH09MYX1_BH09MYX1_07240 [soil metagenome]